MLLFNHDATRHTDEYILKYKLEALEEFKEWKALRLGDCYLSGRLSRVLHSDAICTPEDSI